MDHAAAQVLLKRSAYQNHFGIEQENFRKREGEGCAETIVIQNDRFQSFFSAFLTSKL